MPRSCSPLWGKPSTGEPCAGNPPARFGGRGGLVTSLPYPYRKCTRNGRQGEAERCGMPLTFMRVQRIRYRLEVYAGQSGNPLQRAPAKSVFPVEKSRRGGFELVWIQDIMDHRDALLRWRACTCSLSRALTCLAFVGSLSNLLV